MPSKSATSKTRKRAAVDAKPPPALQPQMQMQMQMQMQPPLYVAPPTDVALANDFCTYLENRVLTKSVGLLRRMLVEFHARQEHTLAQFKCFGANLIAVLPFDMGDVGRRRLAAQLLQQPKPALVDRAACAFEFLFERAASKNLATLKQIFVEFRTHSESTIVDFVRRGSAAVSVIPWEPQHRLVDQWFAFNPYAPLQYGDPSVAPMYFLNHHPQQQPQQHFYHHQPQHVPQAEPRRQGGYDSNAGVPDVTHKHEHAKKIVTAQRKAHPTADLSARSAIARGDSSAKNNRSVTTESATSAPPLSSAVENGKRVVKNFVQYYNEQGEEALIAEVTKSAKRAKKEPEVESKATTAVATPRVTKPRMPTSIKKQKSRKAPPLVDEDEDGDDQVASDTSSIDANDAGSRNGNYSVLKRPKPSSKTSDSMIEELLLQFEKKPAADSQRKTLKTNSAVPKQQQQEHKYKRRRLKRDPAVQVQAQAHTQAQDVGPRPPPLSFHWTQQDGAASQLKRSVRDRMRSIEVRAPWRRVFAAKNVPLPFAESRAPKLAEKLRFFWKSHARSVWERNFWMPLAQDGDSPANVQRKTRQQFARQLFDGVISEAYKVFGAAFFVKLDEQRHPGWWYRRAIVDILALHRISGDKQCWSYVEGQQHERFPDCGLDLPLKSPNYGVLRRHQSASAAMWAVNVKNQKILDEIVEIKDRRARGELLDGGSSSSSDSDAETTTISSGGSSEPSGAELQLENDEEAGDVGPVALEEKLVAGEAEDDSDDAPDADESTPLTNDEDSDADSDEENDSGDDDEEEYLVEKIVLASSLEVDDFKPPPPFERTTTTDSVALPTVENDGTVVETASGGPVKALEKELEPARFAEFIRKISSFGGDGGSGADD